MLLARLPNEVAANAAHAIRENTLRLSMAERAWVADRIPCAVANALVTEAEVEHALAEPFPDAGIARLGLTCQQRFMDRHMAALPAIKVPVALPGGAGAFPTPAVRRAVAEWLRGLKAHGCFSESMLDTALNQNDASVLHLLTRAWGTLAEQVADAVRDEVGAIPESQNESFYVYPAVFDLTHGEGDEPIAAHSVIVATPHVGLYDLRAITQWADDPRLPVLLSGLHAFCRSIRCLHLLSPLDCTDSDYEPLCEAAQYHAADAIQADGSVVIPHMLREQLSEEFGIELDDDGDFATDFKTYLMFLNDPGILGFEVMHAPEAEAAVRAAFKRRHAQRDGLDHALRVIANALRFLEHHQPEGSMQYGNLFEDSDVPVAAMPAYVAGMEAHLLEGRYQSMMESGTDFSHAITVGDQAMTAGLLALRETHCIHAVFAALESLDGRRTKDR